MVVGGSLQGSGAEGMCSDCKPYSATETGASRSHVEPPVSKRGPSTGDFPTEDSESGLNHMGVDAVVNAVLIHVAAPLQMTIVFDPESAARGGAHVGHSTALVTIPDTLWGRLVKQSAGNLIPGNTTRAVQRHDGEHTAKCGFVGRLLGRSSSFGISPPGGHPHLVSNPEFHSFRKLTQRGLQRIGNLP